MLNRILFRNAILLVSLNVIIKPLHTLLIEPAVQMRVGTEDYGRYAALLNIILILGVILDLGVTGWNTVKVAKSRELSMELFRLLLRIRVVLAILYFAAVYGFLCFLGYGEREMKLAFILAMTQILSSLVLWMRSYTSGTMNFRQDRWLSVIDKLLLFLVMAVIIWGPFLNDNLVTIELFIWIQCSISFCVCMLTFYFLKSYRFTAASSTNYYQTIRSAAPFALLFLSNIAMLRVDTIMLDLMMGSAEAGTYMMSYRFFEAIIMIAYLSSNILLPSFARYHKDNITLSQIFNSSFRIIVSGFLLIICAIVIFGNEIMNAIYFRGNDIEMRVFIVLIFSSLLAAAQYVTGSFLTSLERLKVLLFISLGGLLCNVLLNYFLIPHYGSFGSAIACFVTQLFVLFAQFLSVLAYLRNHDTYITGRNLFFMIVVFFSAATWLAFSGLLNMEKLLFLGLLLLMNVFLLWRLRMLNLLFVRYIIKNDQL